MTGPTPISNAAAVAAAASATATCAHCDAINSSNELKRCAACHTTLYCGKDCQVGDWTSHKLVCRGRSDAPQSTPAPNPTTTSASNSLSIGGIPIEVRSVNDLLNPLLHNIPEDRCYCYLIDSFRLRCEDAYVFGMDYAGIYGQVDPSPLFREFLNDAEKKTNEDGSGILPSWWNQSKKKECIKKATDKKKGNHHYIGHAVEKSDIQKYWNDPVMPMKLRMLAEKIRGTSVYAGY